MTRERERMRGGERLSKSDSKTPPAEKPQATPAQARRAGAPARSRTGQPRRGNTRDPESTSAAILAAAVREFTERGYEGARVDNIAARAGVNKRMLYHYFGNKQALYVAVLEGSYTAIRTAEP